MEQQILDEGRSSKFNAGILQMSRIHNLQNTINEVSINPLGWNLNYNIWNYNVWFRSINSLYQEVKSKLSTIERTKGEVIRKVLTEFLKKNPIHETKTNPNQKQRMVFHEEVWTVIHPEIVDWDTEVRDFLEIHKLNSPEEDESAMF